MRLHRCQLTQGSLEYIRDVPYPAASLSWDSPQILGMYFSMFIVRCDLGH